MNSLNTLNLSMLDLVPIREGYSVRDALQLSLHTARHVESLGFERYWLAEHHNMPGIASSATAVLVGHVAAGTQRIRVGSGGIMLPNHAPLVVAEAFGTLAELYPGRIDLGLGRAPGTDHQTMRALRRDRIEREDDFPRDVEELQRLLGARQTEGSVRAVPGAGTEVPIWLLGSSLFSAQLAAAKGLPYAFASHFAPGQLLPALDLYRRQYRPSEKHPEPYVIIGVPLIAANDDAQAEFLASSLFARVLGILTGKRRPLQPPQADFLADCSPGERAAIGDFLGAAVIGGAERVRQGLQALQTATAADEFMFTCDIFDPDLRLQSLSMAADICRAPA